MNKYETKLKRYLHENSIKCDYFSFKQSCHSVREAAKTANVNPEDFVKNICMINSKGNILVAIVKGEDRASTSRISKALDIDKPRIASPDEILKNTGFPCGGVPSFGFYGKFLIDPKVMEKEYVFSSGGSDKSLLKISTKELLKANGGQIVRIRK